MAFNKLYPPIIGNRIPAFYQDKTDNSLFITVPFENNRSVAFEQVYTVLLKIKTIQNDLVNVIVTPVESTREALRAAWDSGVIHYKITQAEYQLTPDLWYFNVGQYYKVQLAYVRMAEDNTDENLEEYVGYYSNVGITKMSWYPTVTIDGLSAGEPNDHIYKYIGNYSQESDGHIMDTTEKVYYYRFLIKYDNSTIEDSGWLLHDATERDLNEYSSYDEFEYLSEVEDGYTIQYLVQTNSGIEAASPEYSLINNTVADDNIVTTTSMNFDNGYVKIEADSEDWPQDQELYVVRYDLATGRRIKIGKITESEPSFMDLTVSQGEYYSYAIWGMENNVYHTNEFSQPILVDFEDIFLFDGMRQLKVRFNPTVSGIHKTLLETKVDTLGGKYPVFMRNGNTEYRDMNLTGLISFLMDEEQLFSIYGVAPQPHRERTFTAYTGSTALPTDLVGENFTRERKFREEVLEWLNDGEIKLFRSPSEGIMMVRIMSVSMTPQTTPSRMIYNFSCQLYEADGHEYEDLVKYNIYNLE